MVKFDNEFVRKLEYLYLISNRAFKGELLARHRSDKRTGGVEFSEHRDYTEGDDLRYLDWNVFARTDNLLIKKFLEEEDLHIHLLLDTSQSMDMGICNKLDRAREITAALAYIALADGDCVSLTTFDSRLRSELAPVRGRQNIFHFLRFLESVQSCGAETDLHTVCHEFITRRPRRGLVVLISDFFDPRGWQKAVDLLRIQQYKPNLIALYDSSDASPELRGDQTLVNVETGEYRLVTVNNALLSRYKRAFEKFVGELIAWCRRHGFHGAATNSRVPFDKFLLNMMERQ
ncbi:MAG: DUF58 domain-containing protein [Planctomycetia bacterium]|nr:DUF58 domain-containing protein [Planctomycetia bacterium]